MEGSNPTYTLGIGPELSLNQPEEKKLLNEEGKRHCDHWSRMYLAQVTRYDTLYAVNQLARVVSNPAKYHMEAAKDLLRYLAGGPTDLSITCKQGGFRLVSFSDVN